MNPRKQIAWPILSAVVLLTSLLPSEAATAAGVDLIPSTSLPGAVAEGNSLILPGISILPSSATFATGGEAIQIYNQGTSSIALKMSLKEGSSYMRSKAADVALASQTSVCLSGPSVLYYDGPIDEFPSTLAAAAIVPPGTSLLISIDYYAGINSTECGPNSSGSLTAATKGGIEDPTIIVNSSAYISQTLAHGPVVSASLISANKKNYLNPFSRSTVALESVGPTTGTLVTITPSNRRQTIDGFGAALTNSAAYELMQLSSSVRTRVLSSLFSRSKGAGISLVRVIIGASDFSSIGNYTYDDRQGPSNDPLKYFNILPYDANVLKILQYAQHINPDLTVIATPFTAPTWMKSTKSYKGGTLLASFYEDYATYIADFVRAYRDHGIRIAYVTPQNEPGNEADNPSMSMTPAHEATFVTKFLAPALATAAPLTRILEYDWNWYSTPEGCGPTDCWNASQLQTALAGRPKNVAGLAWHCYGTNAHQSAMSHFSSLTNLITECTGYGLDGPPHFQKNLDWDSKNLVTDGLNNWASGALFWNLALNNSYGPTNRFCTDCRGVVTVVSRVRVSDNVEFYILLALARSIEPGSTWTSATSSDPNALTVTSASNPDHTMGLYVANKVGVSEPFTVVDGDEMFSDTIPAYSVESFHWTS